MTKEREFKAANEVFFYNSLLELRDNLSDLIYIGHKVVVSTLIDGHHGAHIPEILFDLAGVKNTPEEDWVYDMVSEILDDWTISIRKYFSDDGWSIEFNETDGSIDIFYVSTYDIGQAIENYSNAKTPENLAALILRIEYDADASRHGESDILSVILDVCKNVDNPSEMEAIIKRSGIGF
jgi:hypothetical protein